MEKSNVILATFRFNKAMNDYRAAQYLLNMGYYDAANDRAFFCMFHSARALQAYDNLNYEKTGAVIQNFHEQYIQQRYHDPQLCEMFEAVRESRTNAIFNDDYTASKEKAQQHIKNAEYFLETAKTIAGRRLTLEYDTPDYAAAVTAS